MRTVRIFLAAVLWLAVVAVTAEAAPTESLKDLAGRAEAGAPLRILVGVRLDEPYRVEGELDAAQALAQRDRIAVAQDRVADRVIRAGGRVTARYRYLPYLAAQLPAAELGEFNASSVVASVGEDRLRQPTLLRSTALIGADLAWRAGLTGVGWTVALPDTGVDTTHPFLAGKVVAEACYSSTWTGNSMQPATVSVCPGGAAASTAPGAAGPCDTAIADCDHGTHVAGIVAGRDGPDGLNGIAPRATLIALQIYSSVADNTRIGAWDSDLLRALERVYALRDTQRIAAVNLSLAGSEIYADSSSCDTDHPALADAIELLRSVGIATVAAAGNDGSRSALAAPACLSNVISVGASCAGGPDASFCPGGIDSIATYSNVAPFLGLLAPGSYITSSIPGNGYETLSGTSMAAPHVTGAFALLRQQSPSITVDEALRALREVAASVDDFRSKATAKELRLLDLREVVAAAEPSAARGAQTAQRSAWAAAAEAIARATVPDDQTADRETRSRPALPRSAVSSDETRANLRSTTTSPVPAAVAAGQDHTCALTSGGAVKCWGWNGGGQLGDDSTTDRWTPVDVVGLSSDVMAIAAGGKHTCALTSGGGVKCWGWNGYGQLGDNSTADRLTPADVQGLSSGVMAIAAGGEHTCALTSGGAVKCWGWNGYGQLGDNSTTNRWTPVDVVGLSSGVMAIAAGQEHTCAVTSGGAVKCWGRNTYGQLGDNSTTNRWTPVDVLGLSSGVATIALGTHHTCAVTGGGVVRCWGNNFKGQLGDNSTTDRWTPVDVPGLSSGVMAIGAGSGHTCALTSGGAVKCWGWNYYGELGDGSTTDRWTPVDVRGLSSGVAAIALGTRHTCALTSGGAIKCWGWNYYGELGDGSTTDRWTPVDVKGFSDDVMAIAAGSEHTCALTSGGAVKCWGANGEGRLGDNSTTARQTPVDVQGLSSGVMAIAAGSQHTCALTSGASVKCWGWNGYGQLGDSSTTDRWTPVDVVGLSGGVMAIAAGGYHNCALTGGRAIKCWGRNSSGQLGDDSTTDRWTPVDVVGLGGGVMAIAAGFDHTCALTSGGAVKCWGSNRRGQLGDNSAMNRRTPVDVVGLSSGVMAIAAGFDHTCALTSEGGVKCWGWNYQGQLGDNSTTDRWTPVDVVGLSSGVMVIAAGSDHTCALTSWGSVKCWGRNSSGQLGDNSTTNRLTPVDVVGLGGGVTAIAAGGYHNCVLAGGGAVKCWGSNGRGQLGDNSAMNRWTPVDVVGFAPADTEPEPFGFEPQTDVALGTEVDSNMVTPSGYNTGAEISVANGEYAIGWCGLFRSSPGMIGPGQSVCVRHISSSTPGTTVTTTLIIGGVAGTFSSTTASTAPDVTASPSPLDFKGQSMRTASVARELTIRNAGASSITVSQLYTAPPFAVVSNSCGALSAGASCTARLTFTPLAEGLYTGGLSIVTSAGVQSVLLLGEGERSLVTHYYGAILGRSPDAGGKDWWQDQVDRIELLGADINEVWYAMAMGFFNGSEYLGFGKSDGEFVDDLYRTFLDREPETDGRDWWLDQIAQGLTREVVLVAFMFSDEFSQFTASIFGDTTVRPELNMVMDFYRGLLSRLPDDAGFGFWVQQFRQAQCTGAAAVTAQAESISRQVATGPEYAGRNRTNGQYVGDLYNAILRRGGDAAGANFWNGLLDSNTLTREQVRQQFVQGPEFQGRVAQIIAAGCLPLRSPASE